MKYCTHCGTELSDEIKICTACGCPLEIEEKPILNESKKNKKVKLLLIIVATVTAIALIVGGFFLVNHIRRVNVIKDLSSKTFRYFDSQSYPLLGEYYYTEKEMEFDSEGKLTYSYYYSSIDAGNEYEKTYEIKFKNKMVFLKAGINEFEIRYDKYNEIEAIYDINNKELYD